MSKRTWVILGATSIIAEEFARIAAQSDANLVLVGRNATQLALIASDFYYRYRIDCKIMVLDFSNDINPLLQALQNPLMEYDLFIAYSVMDNNHELTTERINTLLTVNVTHTSQLIHTYWHKPQTNHRLIFLSSVAACRGRSKNSLYGASKAAIEIYLQGLQQLASKTQHITIARLGFIDTHVTFGKPGIFYASPSKICAKMCWKALHKKKRVIYHPFFWRFIMLIIRALPQRMLPDR